MTQVTRHGNVSGIRLEDITISSLIVHAAGTAALFLAQVHLERKYIKWVSEQVSWGNAKNPFGLDGQDFRCAPHFHRSVWEDEMKFTKKQGQYLAFIYCYTKIHGQPPAESDTQKYFRVTYPSIHQMVLTLEKNGLISRVPRQARSINLLIPKEDIPQLDWTGETEQVA